MDRTAGTAARPRVRLGRAPRVLAGIAALALLASCGAPPGHAVDPGPGIPAFTGAARFANPQVVAGHLEVPWGLAFLPDGSTLVSERDRGVILRLRPGSPPAELARVPDVVPEGEGGLLGIAVSPTYARDQLIYAYLSAPTDNRIVRFRPGERPQPILTGIPKAQIHNGGRIAFGPDGKLYATAGDASHRGNAENRGRLGGKILRIDRDGRVPAGNPFPGSIVWSLGHRNLEGLAWDRDGRLFASEFGENQFDEINRIEPGRDYGWPRVEGGGGGAGLTDPLLTWRTEESSPSGIAIDGDTLFAAALRGERLWAVPLDGRGGVGRPTALLTGRFGRLRTVALAPDGALWVTTSNRDGRGTPSSTDDRVLRFPPVP
jgi:glucose/arabinose dehydrogenase